MKVGIVLVSHWYRSTIDFDGYSVALKRKGHDPIMICLDNQAGAADFPVFETTRERMGNPEFWKKLGIEVAIVFSWLRDAPIYEALREAGVCAIARADNDGQGSVRVFPRESWTVSVDPAPNLLDAAKRAKHWAHRYLSLYRAEDADLIASVEACHAVAIESREAANRLFRMFKYYDKEALSKKIHIVPHSVSDQITNKTFKLERRRRVYCGGRWDDHLKGARLVVKTVERLLKRDKNLEFIIAGPAVAERFKRLSKYPQVHLAGLVPFRDMPEVIASSQCMLSASFFETQSIGALEALCLGTTLVATRLPGFVELVAEGRGGTLAKRRSSASLAEATRAELGKWENGQRKSEEIKDLWRTRVTNEAVISAFLSML